MGYPQTVERFQLIAGIDGLRGLIFLYAIKNEKSVTIEVADFSS